MSVVLFVLNEPTLAPGVAASAASGTTAVRPSLWRRPIPLVAAGLIAVLAAVGSGLVLWALRPAPSPGRSAIARLTVTLPAGDQVGSQVGSVDGSLAVSPDRTRIAYVGSRETGQQQQQLYLRALDSLESKAISPAGTEGAQGPFFSPDGQWVGFFAQSKLKKVSVITGAVQILCDAAVGWGGSWGPDGSIVFAPSHQSGLWKVSASGGVPTEITRLDGSKGEVSHRWPQVLPVGKAVLFEAWVGSPRPQDRQIHVQSLETGERRVLVQEARHGRYVSSGHLVYAAQGDQLWAVGMDLARLEVTSAAPIRLAEQVWVGAEGAGYAVSDSGELVYVPGSVRRAERQLVWVDRKGQVEALPLPVRAYGGAPALSPDGRRAIVSFEGNPWIYDFVRATLTPLATGSGGSQFPLWTPDGTRIVYLGNRAGFRNLFWQAVDSTSQEERLTTKANTVQVPGSWSPDGKWLVWHETETNPATGADIFVLHLDGDRKPQGVLTTRFNERQPQFSPDGRWLAYRSDESGRSEIYVQPVPSSGRKWLISTEGGTDPVWSRNGRELFYLRGDSLMAVDITTRPTFSAGPPRLLFAARQTASVRPSYDVSLDGQRFLMIQPIEPEPPRNQIHVVMNWFEELKRLVPTK